MLGKIASMIRKPSYIDKMTATKERLAYTRILVELSYGEKLLDHIKLRGLGNVLFTQRIVYEVRPHQCLKCYHFGHNVRMCLKEPKLVWVDRNREENPSTNVPRGTELSGTAKNVK